MNSCRRIILWGASGHALVVAEIVRRVGAFQIAGFIDDVNPVRAGETFCGATVLGGREALEQEYARGVRALLVAIGANAARMQCAGLAREIGFALATAIHPSAILADDVRIGAGTVIAAGVIVNPAVVVGENVILNTAASVDHECAIEDGAHIGPGARLGGGVKVARGAWVGIGATVKNHVTIGAGAVLGAGAVVVDDIPPRVVAYGVPARVQRTLDEDTNH